MYQSLTGDSIVSEDLLWKDVPKDRRGDLDFLVELLDWDANVDPAFAANRFMRPRPVAPEEEMSRAGYAEHWICYKSAHFSAKRLAVMPGKSVTIRDGGAYGLIVLQGHGRLGVWEVESPALIRFGQLTQDELFVTEQAAREGLTITNPSAADPLVMLKHLGPGNPDLRL
jgi:hypothetical protein